MSSDAVAELGHAVDALVARRLETLSVAELQSSIAGVLPLIDRLGGWVDIAVGELTARSGNSVPAAGDSSRVVPVHAWLRDTTLCGGTAAGGQVRIATLLRQLPQVADAVLTGQVSQASAAVLTRLIGKIDLEQLLASQSSLIEVAAGRDPQALAGWVRELIATHCEPQLEHDERTAQDKRYLQTRNNHDGTIRGSFLLPAADAESLLTALEPLARSTGLSDNRSAGQRRADALVEICEQVLRHGTLPDAGGLRPQLAYIVPAGWAAAQAAAPLADIVHRRARRHLHQSPAGLRQRRLDRTANQSPDRDRAVRRPDIPGPDRRPRPGHQPGIADRRDHHRATPDPGDARPRVHRPRLHPPPGVLRCPPPHPPRARRRHRPEQPGAAVQTAPRPVAPRATPATRPPRPLAHSANRPATTTDLADVRAGLVSALSQNAKTPAARRS